METFRVAIDKKQVTFAAAHFITYGSGRCESLHGHNYRVGVVLSGTLDSYHLLVDFVRLRRLLMDIVEGLDHRMLLATRSEALPVSSIVEGEVEVTLADRRYVFPEGDVVLIDIPNTTAEMLARWISDRLVEQLDAEAEAIAWLEVEVEESPGQSASFRRSVRP